MMEQNKFLSPMISELWSATRKFPGANWDDALSKGQITSKMWLIDEASKVFSGQSFRCAYILGGWYGLLARLWLESGGNSWIKSIRSFDIDPECEAIADAVNRKWVINDWVFKAATADICQINYQKNEYHVTNSKGESIRLIESPDLIVNTSCEHIEQFSSWYESIPQGCSLILQNNDSLEQEGHVNCVKSMEEFALQVPMSEVLYQGSLKLDAYTRFMIMGIK